MLLLVLLVTQTALANEGETLSVKKGETKELNSLVNLVYDKILVDGGTLTISGLTNVSLVQGQFDESIVVKNGGKLFIAGTVTTSFGVTIQDDSSLLCIEEGGSLTVDKMRFYRAEGGLTELYGKLACSQMVIGEACKFNIYSFAGGYVQGGSYTTMTTGDRIVEYFGRDTYAGRESCFTEYTELPYLYFTSNNGWDNTVTLEGNDRSGDNVIEYSTNGREFKTYTMGTAIKIGWSEKVSFRVHSQKAVNLSTSSSDYYHFKMDGSGSVKVEGNVMSLVQRYGNADAVPGDYCFYKLFADNVDMQCNINPLPTQLKAHCFDSMFAGCTNLEKAPELPATKLVDGCYAHMFDGCRMLKSISVGFSQWSPVSATTGWVAGCIYPEGIFYCPQELTKLYGDDNIPHKWYGSYTTVNVDCGTKPGNLASLLAQQHVDVLDDIRDLTITGAMNDEDLITLRLIKGLRKLDMKGVTGLSSLPNSFFTECQNLEIIQMPPVESVGHDVCLSLKHLKEVYFQKGLVEIGDHVFTWCDSLKVIDLPEGLKKIGQETFSQCDLLEEFTMPTTVEEDRGGIFAWCGSLKRVKLSPKLKALGGSMFRGCGKLESVTMYEGLTSIGDDCFGGCESLERLEIPSTVLYINNNAINDCKNLKSLIVKSYLPPFNWDYYLNSKYEYFNLHDNTKQYCTLYVNEASIGMYKSSYPWSKFKDIRPIEGGANYPDEMFLLTQQNMEVNDNMAQNLHPNLKLWFYCSGESGYNPAHYYSNLTVEGDNMLSLKSFDSYYDLSNMSRNESWRWEYKTYFATLLNKGKMRADKVANTIHLNDRKWNFICFPYNVKVKDIQMSHPMDEFVVRAYDANARAKANFDATWYDLTPDSTLQAGRGYILMNAMTLDYKNCEPNSYRFFAADDDKKNDIFLNTDYHTALTHAAGELAHNNNWNLVGNPYPSYYDIYYLKSDAPIVVDCINDYNNQYEVYSPVDDDYILYPSQAFFMQAPVGQDELVFGADGRQHDNQVRTRSLGAKRRVRDYSRRHLFNLYLSQGNQTDRTRLVINPDASKAYETSRDAAKFSFDDLQTNLQLYTMADGVKYAINERPIGEGTVELGFVSPKAGSYTLRMEMRGNGQLSLYDKLTGTVTDLTQQDYTFHTEAGCYEGRLVLLTSADATGVQSVLDKLTQSDAYNLQGQKAPANHKGIIIRDGKKIVK